MTRDVSEAYDRESGSVYFIIFLLTCERTVSIIGIESERSQYMEKRMKK